MKRKHTSYLLLISSVSALGGLLFGYDWVVIGGAKLFYEPFFGLEQSAALRGWAMSSALAGCLAGAVSAGVWSDRYGRKRMLIAASVLFTVSAIGTGAVDTFAWFIAYRILGGFGIGIASHVSPMYIAEVSPASVRGKFVSLNQLTIVTGILLAQVANWFIGELYTPGGKTLTAAGIHYAWRWMFWMETVPAVFFFALSFVIPESPRWLLTRKNSRKEQAFRIFARIGGTEYAREAVKEISDTKETAVVRQRYSLFAPATRKVVSIGVVLAVFQQWCGINVIFNYAHELFSAAGYAVSGVLANIVITGIVNVLFTLVALYTVDRWGRRALLFTGSLGLALLYLLLGTGCYLRLDGWLMLVGMVLAIACYAMTLAPVIWVVLSELFPNRIRGAAMATATFFLWTASFLLIYTFPFLNEKLGAAGTYWIYGGICLAAFLFIYRRLPETKGKSLEEIEEMFTK